MVKATNEGLRLIIELSPEEAARFRQLAKTDDVAYYEGIAKSFVLGMGEAVEPQVVFGDIELLVQLSEYGRRGDLRAQQEWADEPLFTREQLEVQSVKDTICSWAMFFAADLRTLSEGRSAPYVDQVHWAGLSAKAQSLLKLLRDAIKKQL